VNPVSTALITGAMVVAGKWSEGKSPNIDNALGVAGIAIGLSLMEQANERLAAMFGWLIVLSVTIVYFPKIAKGTGLTTLK
jgi:hypothetical protein